MQIIESIPYNIILCVCLFLEAFKFVRRVNILCILSCIDNISSMYYLYHSYLYEHCRRYRIAFKAYNFSPFNDSILMSIINKGAKTEFEMCFLTCVIKITGYTIERFYLCIAEICFSRGKRTPTRC